MKKEVLFRMSSPYRDEFKIYGYRFGSGRKSIAVVGALRGDEVEQQYTCAKLIQSLGELEASGSLMPDCEILVIPCANPYSMNIGKRFWSMDNTDINRMFPGYDRGETTQRIAAALFESVKDYKYGIQLASYYIPGEFIPHVRMLDTGYQSEREAVAFGLPYVYVKKVAPYDTALLNYNWQIWETKAFSLYTGHTGTLRTASVDNALTALLRFASSVGVLSLSTRPGYRSEVISDADFVTLKSKKAGIFRKFKSAQDGVNRGDIIGEVVDPYDASTLESIVSPVTGVIFFSQEKPLVLEGARTFQIIEDRVL